jgi:fermentation-respiration switch protein FrsA (DUF1100 family)
MILLEIYIGLAIVFFFLQRYMVFPGSDPPVVTPASNGWAFEEFRLPVDGQATYGWYIPAENPRGTVLFSHGNAANMGHDLYTAEIFRSLGLNVVQYAYGGYGLSTGRSSEPRCYADIRAVWRWLVEVKGESPDRIILAGRSLGGAVTAQLATEVVPAGVILESTFTSIADMAQKALPWLPARYLVTIRFATNDKIPKIRAPLLFIHSPNDTMIPFEQAKRNYAGAGEPKCFLEIRGDHNDGVYVSEPVYRKGTGEFLLKFLK